MWSNLIKLQNPYDLKKLWCIQIYAKQYTQRFWYHFADGGKLSRLDKCEWWIDQCVKWIDELARYRVWTLQKDGVVLLNAFVGELFDECLLPKAIKVVKLIIKQINALELQDSHVAAVEAEVADKIEWHAEQVD